MKILLALLMLVSITLISTTPDNVQQNTQQQTSLYDKLVTKANFDSFAKKEPIMLILFFKTWCPHVKRFLPEWKKATNTLETQGKYILARSDCDGTGKTLCDQSHIQITNVPTVMFFRYGQRIPGIYCGTEDSVSLLKFVEMAQKSAITNVCTATRPTTTTTTTTTAPP